VGGSRSRQAEAIHSYPFDLKKSKTNPQRTGKSESNASQKATIRFNVIVDVIDDCCNYASNWLEEPDKGRSGWIRTECMCGKFLGYRPDLKAKHEARSATD
jgi:hypothetical protein